MTYVVINLYFNLKRRTLAKAKNTIFKNTFDFTLYLPIHINEITLVLISTSILKITSSKIDIGNIESNRSIVENCAKCKQRLAIYTLLDLKKRDLTDNPSASYLFFNFVNEMVDGIVNDTCLWRYKQQTSNALNHHDQKGNRERWRHFLRLFMSRYSNVKILSCVLIHEIIITHVYFLWHLLL